MSKTTARQFEARVLAADTGGIARWGWPIRHQKTGAELSEENQVTARNGECHRDRELMPRFLLCLRRQATICWIAVSTITGCYGCEGDHANLACANESVFQVDVANPTRDKPQSKLWFAHDSWWAWLPGRQGSSVWRRTTHGWQRQTALDRSLLGLPGRADVWADADTVRAVLVEDRQLAVVTLSYAAETASYQRTGEPARFQASSPQANAALETATIDRDGHNRWWIAYPWRRRMWVRSTLGAEQNEWTEPIPVSQETADDDLCAIVALPGGVALVWSDQAHDGLYLRWHKDEANSNAWDPIEEIDRGNRTADDHIHAAASSDGTLYLATKNSVDRIDHAQLVLRVRHPNGRWENLPYARRTAAEEPSRPIILLGGEPAGLYLLHTRYRRGKSAERKNTIVCQSTSATTLNNASLDQPGRLLIDPGTAVNNVTGCKSMLPAGQPWLVLASDPSGRVYEGRIEPSTVPSATHPAPLRSTQIQSY